MSDSLESLRRKIVGAGDLESVVRTMKVLAASNIVQYEKSVIALADYSKTVELGLSVCFKHMWLDKSTDSMNKSLEPIRIVVFGSDQGLVGQFNDSLADFVKSEMNNFSQEKRFWAVGERVATRLVDVGFRIEGVFDVPASVNAISPLVAQVLIETQLHDDVKNSTQLYLFHNQPHSSVFYQPVFQRLLPLDKIWQKSISEKKWPTQNIPEAIDGVPSALKGLIRDYLFVSIFKACAESLAAENASRLAAMQRAEKNIEELLEELNLRFHSLRQSSIDDELFDLISGSEALNPKK